MPHPGQSARPYWYHQRQGTRERRVVSAAVEPLRRLLAAAGSAAVFGVELHQALGHELHYLAQHVDVGPFLASSVHAMAVAVIMESPSDGLVDRISTLSRTTIAIPQRDSRRHAASRFRATPQTPSRDG